MQTRVTVGLILIAIVGTALVSFSSLTPDFRQAFAGIGLTSEDVAKFLIIRINAEGSADELVFSSFSRVGFVRSTGNEFLLESLPSLDKKPFYELIEKSLAYTIFYDAIDIVENKIGENGLETWKKALGNVMPSVEVKSRRVGGSTFHIPLEVRPDRKLALGIKWLIRYARLRGEKTMVDRLAGEIIASS